MNNLSETHYEYGYGYRVKLICGCEIDSADFTATEKESNEIICPNIGGVKTDDIHLWLRKMKVISIRRIKL